VLQEPGVLGAADAVPDASRAQAQGIPDAVRAGCLARVDRDGSPLSWASRNAGANSAVGCPVGSQNSATGSGLGFYAARQRMVMARPLLKGW
jgi:hypothetical protein